MPKLNRLTPVKVQARRIRNAENKGFNVADPLIDKAMKLAGKYAKDKDESTEE